LRRRALVIFLTELDDPVLADSFVQSIDLLRRQHLVLVNAIQPVGLQPFFSGGSVSTVDHLYSRLGGHLLWHHLKEVEMRLRRCGVRLSLVENEKLTAQVITDYLGVRRRQML
jgi:uncharacterized protein (DUF58 family)